jgi:L-asparagine transporter-like permease
VTYLRFRTALTPDELARLPVRMPAPRAAAWFGIVSLAAISATTFFVDGLQYSIVSFLPFLALMSIFYARTARDVQHGGPYRHSRGTARGDRQSP